MPYDEHEQEPGHKPSPPTYPAEQLEQTLGFQLAPDFEPHIVGKEESQKFGQQEYALFEAARSIGLDTEKTLEAVGDFAQNRVRQLSASAQVRERALLRRILGEEAGERGEIEEEVVGGLTSSEVENYFSSKGPSGDELDYSLVKVRLEDALGIGLAGRNAFAFRPDQYKYYTPLYGPENQPSGLEVETIDLMPRPAIRHTEVVHFSDPGSASYDPEADRERNLLEQAVGEPPDEPVSTINLVAFRIGLSETNRRLDALANLGDLKLRAAVLNRTGLEELFTSRAGESETPKDFRSWE